MTDKSNVAAAEASAISKSSEFKTFIFLAVFLAPILSFVLVGGYGFAIWMSQILLGPPSH